MWFRDVTRTIKTEAWCVVLVSVLVIVMETAALNGPNVCMVKQKYNITKRVKYRAPMWVRTYEWCFSMPPRCSKWNTEMRDLTRLETEERTAEVAVCCPGYKMKDVSCVPICPNGKTGHGCTEDCPDNKWGPNCINECKRCKNGFCSPVTGECECLDGWQGESCDTSMPATTSVPSLEELLTTRNTKSEINSLRVTMPSTTTNSTARSTSKGKVSSSTEIVPITTAVSLTSSITTSRITTIATTLTTILTTPVTKAATAPVTTPPILNIPVPTTPSTPTQNLATIADKTADEIITFHPITKMINSENVTNNATIITTKIYSSTTEEPKRKIVIKPVHNKIQPTERTTTTETPVLTSLSSGGEQIKPADVITTETTKVTYQTTPTETTAKTESTKKETTIKVTPTTIKFKPKEIWIKPAQKGESPIIEAKIKTTHEFPKYRSANKELTPPVTTPKTIIVSIIPTSVSTFKKIALTTTNLTTKNNANVVHSIQLHNKTEVEFTKPMTTVTPTPTTKLTMISRKISKPTKLFILNTTTMSSTSVNQKLSSTTPATSVTKPLEVTKTISYISRTNSMKTEFNKNTSTSLPVSSKTVRNALKKTDSLTYSPTSTIKTTTALSATERTTTHIFLRKPTSTKISNAAETKLYNTTNPPKVVDKGFIKTNVTKSLTKVTTDGPSDDEEFHILTEPEHITAVMGDKRTERTSVDLISVISIAGGVMMAVITVAVIIVMIERCKKPRYDDVRKVNDIRMQVMIDNNDGPPPYVRSIFHTPLPDPPVSEKCHYQPISTLDRNLKQFMRPVVVQTISPIMLENFRGILECHYDHLPRRSHDFEPIQTRSSIVPSMNESSELRQLRACETEAAIEALKCEAKLDVIDNTTSEPLYAEIPCWRPASEHAVEIMNLNGEAVTEL